MVTQEKKQPKKVKKKSKVTGWSTEKMEEKASKQEFKGTEEMAHWRNINQEEIDNTWKRPSVTNRGRSTGKVQSGCEYKRSIQRKRAAVGVEDDPQGATIFQTRTWSEDSMDENLLVVQGIRSAAKAGDAGEPYGRGINEAAKDEGHDRYDKRNKMKGKNGRKQQLGGR